MRLLTRLILVFAILLSVTATANADGYQYSLRQKVVIGYIYAACARYNVDDQGCRIPLQVAWRETRYGVDIYSKVDTFNGSSTSRGVFQWYAGPYGDCFAGGAACSGYYYQMYGLGWRENLYLDTDRGVDMLTSAYRGGPDYLWAWKAYGVIAPDWPGFPPHFEQDWE